MKRKLEKVIEIPGDEDSPSDIEVRAHHQGGYSISRFWTELDEDHDEIRYYGSKVRLSLEDFKLVKKAIAELEK